MKQLGNRKKRQNNLVIEFKDNKYIFSKRALLLFILGTIISVVIMLRIVDTIEFVWLHELFAKHTAFFLQLIFNLDAQPLYLPIYTCPWHVFISQDVMVYINNGCTGLPAMSVFTAVILLTPHSQHPKTSKDIFTRKLFALSTSLLAIYIYNVSRAVIQFYLYSHGFTWNLVHDSIYAFSITLIIHISFFLICVKFLPEIYFSLKYIVKLSYNYLTIDDKAESLNRIKFADKLPLSIKRKQHIQLESLFKKERINMCLIKTHQIDSRIIQFLNESNHKYTPKAIKNKIFYHYEEVTEIVIEKILIVLATAKVVLSENFNDKIYYFA
ncbi:MAG: hypothetical protein KGD73_03795 [Candidatus Lokiarchaeota archaeon]|nr:hypothetical protein [Candidatus Lokiarchaeota archaeon]